MKSRHLVKTVGASLAALAASSVVIQAPAALAEPTATASTAPATAQSTAQAAPSASNTPPTVDPRAQAAGQAYADQYARWAAVNCVDQRSGNTAAGAIIGGALGALTGAAVTGHAGGALAGGAIGAVTGAAVGSTAPASSCPPGYVVRAGAPGFVYAGPAYPAVAYGPGWYQPWVWAGDHWIYRPFSLAYWAPAYWRGGAWVGRPWIAYRRP